jgi:hypothetical protein
MVVNLKMLNLMTYILKEDIDINTRPLEHHNKMGLKKRKIELYKS